MSRRSYGSGSLYSRTNKAGDQTWFGRWHHDGRRIVRRVGPKRRPGSREGLTVTQAERQLQQMIEDTRPQPTRPDLTVEAATTRLIAHLEAQGRRPATLRAYRADLKTHIAPALGATALESAKAAEVEHLVSTMRAAGKKPKTIRNALALLHQVFAYGQRKGWCRDNPAADVDAPKVERSKAIRFLTEDELSRLLAAVDVKAKPFGATDHALFLTAALTGLRQGELLGLRWEDVDDAAGKIRVRRSHVRGHDQAPKTRRGERAVPMHSRVAAALTEQRKRSAYTTPGGLVFPHPDTGQQLDHSSLVRRFKAALKTAGVRAVRFHDLRHTFGTRAAAAGVPMRTLQEWMGHGSITTTMIYADYAPSEQEGEMLEAAFQDPIQDPN